MPLVYSYSLSFLTLIFLKNIGLLFDGISSNLCLLISPHDLDSFYALWKKILHNNLSPFLKIISSWVYFWAIYPDPLINLSIYKSIPHIANYYSFILCIKIRCYKSANQLANLGTLHFQIHFRIILLIFTKSCWHFDWNYLLVIDLEKIKFLMVVRFMIRKIDIYLNLFRVSSINVIFVSVQVKHGFCLIYP